MRTSESDSIRVDFLPGAAHGLPGRVGLTFAPGKRDGSKWDRDLATDLDRLRTGHLADVLVSLMEDFEYVMLGIADLVPEAVARGMEVRRFPIVDGHPPRDDEMAAFAALLRQIETSAAEGRTVVIHCRGGLGRAGTVAAGFLVLRGMDARAAIAAVRSARGRHAIETARQEEWVESVANHLRGGTG